MPRSTLLLLAILAAVPAPAFAQADAYVNEGARELVRLSRLHRDSVDRRIESYGTTARERFTVALRAGIAEKLVYRRETATRIDWQRDGTTRLEILGMREVAPLFKSKPDVPGDLSAELLRLVFDPAGTDLFIQFDTVGLRHPLAANGEAHYRYEAGDTTTITLPDSRVVRLFELRVMPRRDDIRLLAGSFWLDSESYAVVRIHARPARDFDADRDNARANVASVEREDGDSVRTRSITLNSIAGFVKPVRAEVEFIAIEYGLWDMQWWLPRSLAARGHVRVSGLRVPLSYERTYEEYTVTGDVDRPLIAAADVDRRRCLESVRWVVNTPEDSAREALTASERARRERAYAASRARRGDTTSVGDCTREYVLTAPTDSVLLHSDALPVSIYGDDIALIPEDDLGDIIERMRDIAAPPARAAAPQFQWGLRGPGLLRYNRVEGFSPGVRGTLQRGPYGIEAIARFGLADLEPRGELSVERSGDRFAPRVALYRRLNTAHPVTEVPGLFGSMGALLLGRDDAHYYDALGADLVVRPADAHPQWYDARIYAERQRSVERNTQFSVAHLINSNNVFDPNFRADAADQLGARLRLRTQLGRNPNAPRLSGELSLGGETGDFTFFRPEALLRLGSPLFGGVALGIEAAVGTAEGDAVPAQALWRLG
ncbi:MAG TPA: hypothetical protein VK928_11695, partial [Longimicrobiales bacterium]|nr:hypothetical protein [Longimicrobiales bacterium]